MPSARIPNGIGKRDARNWVSNPSLGAMTWLSLRRQLKYLPMRFSYRNYPGTLNSCETWGIQFMMRLMNFRMPTDAAIHTAFEKGETAVMELFHHVADQMAELARQLAKQGEVLQDLQARLAKHSNNS